MDYESERTRKLGCWDGVAACTGPINAWTTNEATSNFEPDLDYCNFLIDIGFGKNCSEDMRQFWQKTIQANYQGDDGRRRARMAAINLRERDGLHGRLWDVKCPVLWLHVSFSVREEWRLMLVVRLVTAPGLTRSSVTDSAIRVPTMPSTRWPTLKRRSSFSRTRRRLIW